MNVRSVRRIEIMLLGKKTGVGNERLQLTVEDEMGKKVVRVEHNRCLGLNQFFAAVFVTQ